MPRSANVGGRLRCSQRPQILRDRAPGAPQAKNWQSPLFQKPAFAGWESLG